MENYKESEKYIAGKKAWAAYCMSEQIWDVAQTSELVKTVVSAIPPEKRAAYPVDDKDAAYMYFQTWAEAAGVKANGGKDPERKPVETKKGGKEATAKSEFKLPELSSEVIDATKNNIKSHREERYKTMAATSVEKLVWERGPLDMYKDSFPTLEAVVDISAEQLADYEKDLVEIKEEFRGNFQKIKDAVLAKKPLAINLGSTAPQPKGAIIKTPKAGEGKTEIGTEIKDVNALKGFLLGRVPLRIPSKGEINLGVKLSEPKAKDSSSTTYGETIAKRYDMKMVYSGKKEAYGNPKFAEYLSEVATDANGKVETKEKVVPIALAFQVKKRDKDTKEIIPDKYVTVRLRAKVQFPIFKRKDNDVVKAFPSKSEKGFINSLESAPDKVANDIAYEKAIMVAISGQETDPKLFGEDFLSILDTANSAKKKAAVNATTNFDEE